MELETEDAIFHLQAPADGTVGDVKVEAGKTVLPGTAACETFNPGVGSVKVAAVPKLQPRLLRWISLCRREA